jgi:outer membrane protein
MPPAAVRRPVAPRRRATARAAIVALALSLAGAAARADDLMIPMEFEVPNVVGLGVGAYPDWPGSGDSAVGVAPLARISLGGARWARLLANDLRANLLDHPDWHAGPLAVVRFGRSNVDDPVVRRVHEIDPSLSLGLFGGWQWRGSPDPRQQVGFGGWALGDVSGVYDGWTAGLNASVMQPIALPLAVGAGVGVTWASGNFMNEYFGVTPLDALNSGLPVYRAGAGLRDARAWVAGVLHLSPQWHLAGGALFARLLDDAADSPLVTERGSADQWVYGISALYAW